jgi:hypothetical protein
MLQCETTSLLGKPDWRARIIARVSTQRFLLIVEYNVLSVTEENK